MTTIPKAAIKASEAAFEQAMHDGQTPLEAAILAALPHLGEQIAYAWIDGGKIVKNIAYPRPGGNAITPLYPAPPAQAIPEGWRLVPVEPTEVMQRAGWSQIEPSQPDFYDVAGVAYRAMLAAAPEPPANSKGSLDGSAEPMMTDEEIAEFIKENGQPEDTFPYLRVPLTPAADQVKARLVEALRRARDEIRRYSYIESATSKAFIDDYNERMVPLDAAIAAAEAEENTNKG